MEELFEQFQQILNTEEGQKQIQGVLDLFGGSQESAPDLSSLLGNSPSSDATPPAFDPKLLLLAQQLLSNMNQDDDNTRLLLALKPHFKEERQKKVDFAVQFLRLFALYPVIKESGLLEGLFHAE